jgi:hypothetical protein
MDRWSEFLSLPLVSVRLSLPRAFVVAHSLTWFLPKGCRCSAMVFRFHRRSSVNFPRDGEVLEERFCGDHEIF